MFDPEREIINLHLQMWELNAPSASLVPLPEKLDWGRLIRNTVVVYKSCSMNFGILEGRIHHSHVST